MDLTTLMRIKYDGWDKQDRTWIRVSCGKFTEVKQQQQKKVQCGVFVMHPNVFLSDKNVICILLLHHAYSMVSWRTTNYFV